MLQAVVQLMNYNNVQMSVSVNFWKKAICINAVLPLLFLNQCKHRNPGRGSDKSHFLLLEDKWSTCRLSPGGKEPENWCSPGGPGCSHLALVSKGSPSTGWGTGWWSCSHGVWKQWKYVQRFGCLGSSLGIVELRGRMRFASAEQFWWRALGMSAALLGICKWG